MGDSTTHGVKSLVTTSDPNYCGSCYGKFYCMVELNAVRVCVCVCVCVRVLCGKKVELLLMVVNAVILVTMFNRRILSTDGP